MRPSTPGWQTIVPRVGKSPIWYRTRRRIYRSLINVFLIMAIAATIVPIYWMIATSLKTTSQMVASPPLFAFSPTFENYLALAGRSRWLIRNLFNSVSITALSSFFTLFIGSMAGFSFSRYRFPGHSFLAFTVLWTRTLPPIVAIVPLFLWMSDVGLVDSHLGLAFIYTALNLPFAVWMLKNFFDGVPVELEEAAMIDGCSRVGAYRRVTIPLAAPGMAATAIFVAVLAWNEFLFALIFTNVRAKTLPVVVMESIVEDKLYWMDMATIGTIIMLPMFFFAAIIYRHLVKGLSFGAMK